MKGIVLAGGTGSRLFPVTEGVSKQLLPVYDKPMVYYPLSVLMLAGIREILIITTPEDQGGFIRMLGDGSRFGIDLSYAIQEKPEGLAQAFIIGEQFIGDKNVALVLGDNIFYGANFKKMFLNAVSQNKGATIFSYWVDNPQCFGVAELNKAGKVVSIEEKPAVPKSNYAVTGLYFFDNNVVEIAKSIKPSARGELEITEVINAYLKQRLLHVEKLGRGYAWLDTGTHDSLLEAGSFVQTLEKRQGLKVACLEEIALENQWLTKDDILCRAEELKNNSYGKYLKKIVGFKQRES